MKALKILLCFLIVTSIQAANLPPVNDSVDDTELIQDEGELLLNDTGDAGFMSENAVQNEWDNFLDEKGLEEGFDKEKKIFIGVGSAVTSVDMDHEQFITARTTAFKKALMEAKASFAQSFAEEISSGALLSSFENDKEGELVKLAKSLNLPNVDKYTPTEIKQGDIFTENIAATASAAVSGAAILNIFEGGEKDGYEIIVGIVWSPNLASLSADIARAKYKSPKVKAGKGMKEIINLKDMNSLISKQGAWVHINENGQRIIVGYGQAGVKKADSKKWFKKNLKMAQKRARLNALNHIKEFVSTNLSVNEMKTTLDASLKKSDGSEVNAIADDFAQVIAQKASTIKLVGITPYKKRWAAKHPLSGQYVAGSILVWSPDSAELSKLFRGLSIQADEKVKLGQKDLNKDLKNQEIKARAQANKDYKKSEIVKKTNNTSSSKSNYNEAKTVKSGSLNSGSADSAAW